MASMSSWLFIAILTFSSSIDNLGVGLSYGIRNIRISFLSNAWITVICFLFSMSGIYLGLWISEILPGTLPVVLGSALLIIIGIRIMLLTGARKSEIHQTLQQTDKTQPQNIKKVIQDPTCADFDNSKDINFFEATLLGAALSANALTNGVGAGLLGFSPVLISLLAAAGSFFTVWAGCHCGIKLTHVRVGKYTIGEFGTLISGALLFLIAAAIFIR